MYELARAGLNIVLNNGHASPSLPGDYFTWGPQAIMFINIRIEIRRNDRLSAAQ